VTSDDGKTIAAALSALAVVLLVVISSGDGMDDPASPTYNQTATK
jgi:hypothetical protein